MEKPEDMRSERLSAPEGAGSSAHLSIGAVSLATGIPADTLRTWERRYGFPTPLRTPSGHRLYAADTVERLQLITAALQRGHRVSQLAGLDLASLRALSPVAAAPPVVSASGGALSVEAEGLRGWLEAVESLDEGRLRSELQFAWSRYGAVRCLEGWIGPFLREVGEGWERGRLRVLHEHFASECVREFLTRHWRGLSKHNTGPQIVLATLPGEEHALGLHIAACVLALAGLQILFLGANTPLEDIRQSAERSGSRLIAISVSYGVHSAVAYRHLTLLREGLPAEVSVLVGGGGLSEVPAGVDLAMGLEEALGWGQRASKASRLGPR